MNLSNPCSIGAKKTKKKKVAHTLGSNRFAGSILSFLDRGRIADSSLASRIYISSQYLTDKSHVNRFDFRFRFQTAGPHTKIK